MIPTIANEFRGRVESPPLDPAAITHRKKDALNIGKSNGSNNAINGN